MIQDREAIINAVIQAFYRIYNSLGIGFLEKVYENALALELREEGLTVQQQQPITVFYKDQMIGEYFADLLVENQILVELKVARSIAPQHEAQVLNYLKASTINLGVILNCGPKPEFKRKIYEHARRQTAVLSNPQPESIQLN